MDTARSQVPKAGFPPVRLTPSRWCARVPACGCTWYTLKVVCEGARLRVYVDGTLYLDYTDPEPYMQGMVGIRTHNCPAVFEGLNAEPLSCGMEEIL